MKIFLAHASAFDFENKLYIPIRSSPLSKIHEFILPEEQKYSGTWNTKDAIRGCNLFIADVSVASTGAGIELGWADANAIPILIIHEQGTTPSSVVSYVSHTILSYQNGDDLIRKLSTTFEEIERASK